MADARPVAVGVMVAKAAACMGRKAYAIPAHMRNMSPRISHKLVSLPIRHRSDIIIATPVRPAAMSRRGPTLR